MVECVDNLTLDTVSLSLSLLEFFRQLLKDPPSPLPHLFSDLLMDRHTLMSLGKFASRYREMISSYILPRRVNFVGIFFVYLQ